ncbi:uncharacterized protein C8Q71DRAFT_860050 [Rhodofomes roseus]|uniref:RGS domain-containing protein n=1 Tax=Rhodofomes roseus TaxID=34475 RepID=A0ABQ8K8Z9_9APHY|nr:uncharacterized protein C8Q71DRAFT_860050 [Rhodofomes roseus]KAH9833778.1 hypothetical protein C8Q71DRAFT_860050 [Rhodofomes roseus]
MQEKPTKRPIKRKEASRLVGRAAWNGIARFFSRDGGMPSLAMVLAGDTCYPVSVKNFEAYLAYQARDVSAAEHSVEVLQFVVWFQDYRRRFLALPPHVRAASPGHSHFAFAIPTPARTADRVRASNARASLPSSYKLAACVRLPPVDSAVAYPDSAPSLATPNSPLLSQPLRPASDPVPRDQPFKEECMRIVATFLRPGTAKELPLDAALRDTTIRDLTWNTHPDVFLPVYAELCYTLETLSLPRFLAAASANINRSRRLFYGASGIFETAVGVFLAVLLVCVVRVPPEANRAWRLLAVLPAMVGMMQLYAVYRGFCSWMWSRGKTQLHEWELEEMDAATGAHWDALLAPPPADGAKAKAGERWEAQAASFTIAPFNAPLPEPGSERASVAPRHHRRRSRRCSPVSFLLSRLRPPSTAASPSPPLHPCSPRRSDPEKSRIDAYAAKRAPLFGPEKVVLDPRIRALHRRAFRDVLCFGLVATAIFAAVVLSVPGRRR